MTKLRKRNIVITMMLIVMMLASSISVDAASKKVWTTGANSPSTITKGKTFSIKGTIKSKKKIKKVEIGIVNSSNKWTKYKYTKKLNAKKFNIKKADSKLKFGKLAVGKYNYRIYVHTSDKKVTCVMDKPFYVVAKNGSAATSSSVSTGSGSAGSSDGVGITSEVADVSLSNANYPGDYSVGRGFNPRGIISSSEPITRVEIGIVFAPTNKWMRYKYDASVNSKTFDISRAASSLKFDRLPGGKYRYRIYAHTAGGVKLVCNKAFTVTPSNKPQAAVNWAINIANDNSFSYGKKPGTSKVGCYFCGTNQKRKPAGYEKTYVCMTFVHAAYAHGAGDPEVLKDCQNGSHCLSETDTNMTRYTCWEKIGLAKDLTVDDLQPGDVICYYAANNYSGHLCIYVGGNNIVDSEGISDCWGPNSIAVRNKAAKMLKNAASFSSKSYVMRYNK